MVKKITYMEMMEIYIDYCNWYDKLNNLQKEVFINPNKFLEKMKIEVGFRR